MTGNRIHTANLKAKKRLARGIWGVTCIGQLRKNNTVCSCQMCRNPRRTSWASNTDKLTAQERRAPKIREEWY